MIMIDIQYSAVDFDGAVVEPLDLCILNSIL